MQPNTSILGGMDHAAQLPTPSAPHTQPTASADGLPRFRKFGDHIQTRKLIFDNVLAAAHKIEPVANPRHSLSIESPHWTGPDNYSLADQKQAVLSGGTLTRKLVGNLVLRDPTGSVISQKAAQLAKVPYMTDRGTFIMGGNEYTMAHQMRLRPGVFTRIKKNGELESHVNVSSGFSHRVFMDPATGIFRVEMGQAKIPLMPLLQSMGVTPGQMRESWGNELTAANMAHADPQAIGKLYHKLYRNGNAAEGDQHQAVKDAFAKMTLDPEVTKRTLGHGFTNVGPEALLATTQKILRVSRGEDEPDDRDSLAFQHMMGPEDLFAERLAKAKGVTRQMLWRASARNSVDSIAANPYDESIKSALMGSGLGMPLEEINPADIFDQQSRVTRMGEGGISSLDAVPDEARSVQPSQFGFIDFLRTPECYDEHTEVMTKQGWKRWNLVSTTDEFACLIAGQIEFHHAESLHQGEYTGPMYGCDTGRINYLVTPNHRMWVSPQFNGAQYRLEPVYETNNSFRRVCSGGVAPWIGGDQDFFEFPPHTHNSNNSASVDRVPIGPWAELMGWWIGEGSCTYVEEKSQYYVKITQSQSANPDNCQRIENLLRELPFAWNYSDRAFMLATKQLASYFKPLGNSPEREIPAYLMDAPLHARKRLYEALLAGEGRHDRRGVRTQFCTSSSQLALDFARLAFSLGYATRQTWEKDDRPQSTTGGCYVVHIHKNNEHQLLPNRKGASDFFVKEYTGCVYCATVPGGLLYVRRHGDDRIGFWCGNSGKVGVDSRLARAAVKGEDGNIYTRVRDLQGNVHYKTPQEFADSTVAFPNELGMTPEQQEAPWISDRTGKPIRATSQQRTMAKTHVAAMQNGKVRIVPRSEVKYEVPDMESTFSPLGNMIPMKSMVKGQRAVMAARMITQALPVHEAEAPFVQSGVPGQPNRSFEEEYAKHMGAIHADKPMRVTAVDENGITTVDQEGNQKTHQLYHNFPYNRKSVCGETRVIVRRNGVGIWEGRIADYVQTADDHVLSINPTTHQSSWQLITGFIKHENDKKTYRVKTESGREVVVTQDHSLVTLGDNGQLQPIYPLDCIVGCTRLPIVKIPVVSVESPNTQDMRDLGRLAGLYLAEGHCPPSQPGLIIIAVEPDDRANEVLQLLNRLQPEYPPYRNGGSVNFTDHARCRWLVETFGHLAGHKFIPGAVLGMPCSFLVGLVEGYFGGDGCLWADGNSAIQLAAVSTSLQLRDGMLDVLSRLGVFATMWDAPRTHLNPNWNDGYGLRVISSHISKLNRWFFYKDREDHLRTLLKKKYRASPFELVPVPSKPARRVLYAGFDKVPMYVYKTAHQGAVSKDRIRDCRGVYGEWGRSDVLWDQIVSIEAVTLNDPHVYDFSVEGSEVFAVCHGLLVHNTFIHQTPTVKPGDTVQLGQLMARSNFTDANGVTALGKNARVAYIPWHGLNFEDANLVSASFAKKMASEHMYQHAHEWEANDHPGKNAYVSMFPSMYTKQKLDSFDDDGIIKPGTKVSHGDPLILIAREQERNKKSMLAGNKSSFRDHSHTWEHENDGVVTDVVKTAKGASVVVKSTMPMQVGDKLSGRYGDKGVVSHIIPDDQMPTDKGGKPFEVLLNPLGVISRTNPAQIAEAALGKIAAHHGRPYKIQDFNDEDDMTQFALNELKKHGMQDTEDLHDPTNGRVVPEVFTGNRWFMKLHHTSESKGQGRGLGAYTAEGAPAKGGTEGAKRIGMLETNALLSHGATEVIRDGSMIRGQANPQYWAQYMSGFKPPVPAVPHVYHKFVNSLRAAGINVLRDGSKTHIMALTNKDVDALSGNRALRNTETVDWRTMAPVKGGLFDQELTGGHSTPDGGGNRWANIPFHEPMPNPVMEEPIRRVLGITTQKFNDVIAGKDKLNGNIGPKAIGDALDNIDLGKELERARADIKSGKRTARDAAVRRLGYLKSAERLGIHPREWMLDKAPVLPPAFRPVSTMGAKKLPLVADPNYLYKELFDSNNALKNMSQQVGDQDLGDERSAVYNAFKAVTGLGDPTHPKNQERQVKGILKHVFGSSPKLGMVQRKLLGSTTDLVGRSVITPDPDLDMDQAGIPENQAWSIYRPIIVRHLVQRGMSRLQAARTVEERSPAARQALLHEMDNGVVVINRAPTLHRYGMMAARPKLTQGNVLKVSPLVVGGFGADFDGDAMQYHVPVSPEARQEALEKMLPSRNLLSAATFKVHYAPSQEYVGGLYESSARIDHNKPPMTFATTADAIRAYKQGRIEVGRRVEVLDK